MEYFFISTKFLKNYLVKANNKKFCFSKDIDIMISIYLFGINIGIYRY